MHLLLSLSHFGLSFIDDSPTEMLYLSLSGLELEVVEWGEKTRNMEEGGCCWGEKGVSTVVERVWKVFGKVDKVQIDNMMNESMPVILAPRRLDLTVPFLQLLVSFSSSRLHTLQFRLQELSVQVDSTLLLALLKFMRQVLDAWTGMQSKIIRASQESFEKGKEQGREVVARGLGTDVSEGTNRVTGKKIGMELVHFGAVKVYITFRLEKKVVEFDVSDPLGGFGALDLFYTLFAGVASISNSPLNFKELVLIDRFVEPEVLVKSIAKNYMRQAGM